MPIAARDFEIDGVSFAEFVALTWHRVLFKRCTLQRIHQELYICRRLLPVVSNEIEVNA